MAPVVRVKSIRSYSSGMASARRRPSSGTPSSAGGGGASASRDAAYDPSAFPAFAVTVDVVVFTLEGGRLHVLLVQRGTPPHERAWALPGGFVLPREGLEEAARRELAEETGVESGPRHLEQLGAYGDPDRDPRMRVVTVAWWAVIPELPTPQAGSDAAFADLIGVDEILDGQLELAFDHRQILEDALEALRQRLEDTTLASAFEPGPFRISDLRRVYEAVWGVRLEPGNFQRKVRKVPGWLEPCAEEEILSMRLDEQEAAPGRPAQYFRAPDSIRAMLSPMRRPEEDDPDAAF
jgi:8-oxo-dGTP diphosphatase